MRPSGEETRRRHLELKPVQQQLNARLVTATFPRHHPFATCSLPRPDPVLSVSRRRRRRRRLQERRKTSALSSFDSSSSSDDRRATVIVMSYRTVANALKVKALVSTLTSEPYAGVVREVVMLWNNASDDYTRPADKTSTSPSEFPQLRSWTDEPARFRGPGGFVPPPDFLKEFGDRARLVLAPTNDLLNRYDTSLTLPATNTLVLLDDDDPAPEPLHLAVRLRVFRAHGRTGVVGAVGRSRIYAKNLASSECAHHHHHDKKTADDDDDDDDDDASVAESSFRAEQKRKASTSAAMYTGHGNPRGCAWIAEPIAATFDVALADAFMHPAHRPLHDFVRTHPVHPDDFAFGGFAAWATGRGAIIVGDDLARHLVAVLNASQASSSINKGFSGDKERLTAAAILAAAPDDSSSLSLSDRPSLASLITKHKTRPHRDHGRRRASSAAAAPESSSTPPDDDEDDADDLRDDVGSARRRRRLGMAGAPNWHFHRAWAAVWVEHYFGGAPTTDTCLNPTAEQLLGGEVFKAKPPGWASPMMW